MVRTVSGVVGGDAAVVVAVVGMDVPMAGSVDLIAAPIEVRTEARTVAPTEAQIVEQSRALRGQKIPERPNPAGISRPDRLRGTRRSSCPENQFPSINDLPRRNRRRRQLRNMQPKW